MSEYDQNSSAAPSIGELIRDVASLVSTLIRGEVALAKLELRDAVAHMGVAFALFVVAAVLALSGYIFSLIALMLLMAPYVGSGWAAAIVTLILFVSAGAAAVFGRKKLLAQNIRVPAAPGQAVPAVPMIEPTRSPEGGSER